MQSSWQIKPIGVYRGQISEKKLLSRQSGLSMHSGYIRLENWINPEQSLKEIQGFSHLWIIFGFHESQNWKSMTRPPKFPEKKVGVFASRSPYRPNHLGLSLVKLVKVSANKLWLEQVDLLDKTPIFDIKPYLPEFESIANAKQGWAQQACEGYKISWGSDALSRLALLPEKLQRDLQDFVNIQLCESPFPSPSKRIRAESDPDIFVLAFRRWRIQYQIAVRELQILKIFEGDQRLRSSKSD